MTPPDYSPAIIGEHFARAADAVARSCREVAASLIYPHTSGITARDLDERATGAEIVADLIRRQPNAPADLADLVTRHPPCPRLDWIEPHPN